MVYINIFQNFKGYIFCVSQTDDGEDDLKKGTQLLEIYALEIQMFTAQKNNKKLKVNILCGFHSKWQKSISLGGL